MAGHVACIFFLPEIICFVGLRNWMEEKIVHRSLFTTQWKRLVRRPRWKILTSSYTRCDVSDGLDLSKGSCKPIMNVHFPCNVGSFCTCWATACFTSIQTKPEATLASYSFHAQAIWSKPLIYLCLVPGLRICVELCMLYLHTPL